MTNVPRGSEIFGVCLLALWVGYFLGDWVPITSDGAVWVGVGFLLVSALVAWYSTK